MYWQACISDHISVLWVQIAFLNLLILCQAQIWTSLLSASILGPYRYKIGTAACSTEADEAQANAVAFVVERLRIGGWEDIRRDNAAYLWISVCFRILDNL